MSQNTTFVGLDVHKDFIQLAALPPGSDDPVEWTTPNTSSKMASMLRKLRSLGGSRLEMCYEAGPTGYALLRQLTKDVDVTCHIVAPSLIPIQPGSRIKTDRRDARKLASYLKAGLLTAVRPPTLDEEALRELSRARTAVKEDHQRAKHQVTKFLLRHGRRYDEGKTLWTKTHGRWLERQKFERPLLQAAFEAHLRSLHHAESRLEALDEELAAASQRPELEQPIALLQCFKGIQLTAAMTLVSELFDIERFPNARKLMAYVGLTASEHSSGGVRSRGGITKAGNRRLRSLLTEISWSCTRSRLTGRTVAARRVGQPSWAISLAERAQRRLYRRFWHLVHAGKPRNVALTAIAREFIGFIWAMLVHQRLLARSGEPA